MSIKHNLCFFLSLPYNTLAIASRADEIMIVDVIEVDHLVSVTVVSLNQSTLGTIPEFESAVTACGTEGRGGRTEFEGVYSVRVAF
jgi:hypothetical protein